MSSLDRQQPSLRLATRGSALALRQAAIVRESLLAIQPDLQIEIVVIRTQGDEPLPGHSADDFEGPFPFGEGVFVRMIEAALLAGRIDIAVHSFKDMPSVEPPGLIVAAFPPREDPRDVLVTTHGASLRSLAIGARVGTGSPRREALLLAQRPDLHVVPIRGNVDTRLRRVEDGVVDGLVLAAAGLKRLGREAAAAEWLDPAVFVPAIGQGTLAVQVRSDDANTRAIVSRLDDPETRLAALAERAVAIEVQAGCTTAIAAYAQVTGNQLAINGFMLAEDGASLVRSSAAGPKNHAEELGARLGAELLRRARVIQAN